LIGDERRIGPVIGRGAENLRPQGRALKDRRPRPTTRAMIESTQAAAAATTSPATTAAARTSVKNAKSFAGELAKTISASATTAKSDATATAKPAARPDGEQTKKVAGHAYARIENGDDKGLYLNEAAGNPRQGAAFRLVEHNDHVFHVYGSGKDKVIVAMTPKAAAATTGGATPATT
jgi:hypothetical protein